MEVPNDIRDKARAKCLKLLAAHDLILERDEQIAYNALAPLIEQLAVALEDAAHKYHFSHGGYCPFNKCGTPSCTKYREALALLDPEVKP